MKTIAMLFAAFVLTSLGFTMNGKRDNIRNEEQAEREFKASGSRVSSFHQSRKDISTWD